MNNYVIISNKTELDTFEDLSISLNYAIDDILDISKRNTSFSKTISLPGTPKNNKFFKQIFDTNISNVNFNPNVKIPSTIRIGDNEVLNGSMQLMNIIVDNKNVSYEITIAGTLKDIITQFGDYDLRDGVDLSEYDHIRNRSNIIDSWSYNVSKFGVIDTNNEVGTGYVYPHIINGNSYNIADTLYIYDTFPAPYVKTVLDKTFEFANFTYESKFFNSDYFKKLILPYTDDKLQMTEEQFDEKKVVAGVPSSTTYMEMMQNSVSNFQVVSEDGPWYKSYSFNYEMGGLSRESGTVIDGGNELDFTDDLGQWSNDIFTCTNTGRYDFVMDGNVFPAITHIGGKNNVRFKSGTFEYLYKMILLKANGTSQTLDASFTQGDPYGKQEFQLSGGEHDCSNGQTWYDTGTKLAFTMTADNVFMEAGDRVVIYFAVNYPGSVKWYGSSDKKHRLRLVMKQSDGGVFSKFTATPSSNDTMGNELVVMNQMIPSNFKMKDFFLNLVTMFNLIIQDDPNKDNNLIIEPRDDFFASKQKVLDWSLKLDNDSEVKITPMSELDAKTYEYKYAKDTDLYNQSYTDETTEEYGELTINVINDFSEKTNKTTLVFAPTPDSSLYLTGLAANPLSPWVGTATTINYPNRVAPFFVESSDSPIGFKAKKVKPRILFYGGLIDCNPLYLIDHEVSNAQTSSLSTEVTQYPYCGMWDHPTSPKHDLGFGKTKKIYWDTTAVPNNTLYEQFHKATLNNITDIDARLLEASFHLTPKDIAEFDFRDIVFLNGGYWRVNKIKDFNPVGSDSLTKVVLYKIIDLKILSPYSVSVPTSNATCPTDMIIKISKNGKYHISASGQEVTEDCCKSVGGNWANGVCSFKKKIIKGDGGISINSDSGIVPTKQPYGPESFKQNNNSIHTPDVRVFGSGNYVPSGTDSKLIIGDNNSIGPDVEDVIIIGDGIYGNEEGTIYLGNIKITQDGNILSSGIVIIDGGLDDIFPFDKTNFIDVIDGSLDAVRTLGGDSKARPIIDGSEGGSLATGE